MVLQMYVSLQGDNRIARYLMDPESDGLKPNGAVEISGGPAPLAFNPSHTAMYVGRRDSLQLSSYAIDQANGDLTHTGDVALGGEPCYLSTDHTGRYALSAYYQAGYCAVPDRCCRRGGRAGDRVAGDWFRCPLFHDRSLQSIRLSASYR